MVRKVMVVEDDPLAGATALEAIRELEGFEPFIVTNLQVALEKLEKREPDIVLTDLHFLENASGEVGPVTRSMSQILPGYPESQMPLGLKVLFQAMRKGIPCVIVTQEGGHGEALQYIFRNFAGAHSLKGLVCSAFDKGRKQPWEWALKQLCVRFWGPNYLETMVRWVPWTSMYVNVLTASISCNDPRKKPLHELFV